MSLWRKAKDKVLWPFGPEGSGLRVKELKLFDKLRSPLKSVSR
jgi:hypothetical protein